MSTASLDRESAEVHTSKLLVSHNKAIASMNAFSLVDYLNELSFDPFKYFNTLCNFGASSSVGCCTRVVKNFTEE